ncbi:acetate--CoA ligase family protein [Amycolatopsis sp. NPDC058340]|uniref:acetate--CoA ligase family protein n=1 Tax=Amycolatopsis sp. NPDC058340 TaxID=3346453 RepID=UPI003664C891
MKGGIDGAQWESFTAPRRIAVVGASPRPGPLNFAQRLSRNNAHLGFTGTTYFVNPRHDSIFGLPCYPDLGALPEKPDVCLINTPARQVLGAVDDGITAGVRSFVVHSGGFGETGAEGHGLQAELRALCEETGAALIGPNCLGMYHSRGPVALYGADIPPGIPRGGLAVLSGSGSVSVSMMQLGQAVGLHSIVSTGNEAVTTAEDMLEHLVEDPEVTVVAMFVEALRRPDKFRTLARRANALGKPIVALKAGTSEKGAAAAGSHTGAMVGTGAAYRALFDDLNVIAVDDFEELRETVRALTVLGGQRPTGPGVAVAGISGGKLSVVVDLAERLGMPIASLAPETVHRLDTALALPAETSAHNPVDVGAGFRSGKPGTENLADCVRILASDPGVGLVLVQQSLSGSGHSNALERSWARAVADAAADVAEPVVIAAEFPVPPENVEPDSRHRSPAGSVPVLSGLRPALCAVRALTRWHRGANRPWTPPATSGPAVDAAALLDRLRDRHGLLTPAETERILAAYGLPILPTGHISAEAELDTLDLEFPVVAKVVSPDIAHKSDIGGVVLGIASPAELRAAYRRINDNVRSARPDARVTGVLVAPHLDHGVELFMGSRVEPGLGATVAVGLGGTLVELLGHPSVLTAPLDQATAHEAITRMTGAKILDGFRGGPTSDVGGLATTLCRLGRLTTDLADRIVDVDLNPIIVTHSHPGGLVADARIVLD